MRLGVFFVILGLILLFAPIIPQESRYYSVTQLNDICKGFFGQLSQMFSQDAVNSCSLIQFGYYLLLAMIVIGFVLFIVGILKKKQSTK